MKKYSILALVMSVMFTTSILAGCKKTVTKPVESDASKIDTKTVDTYTMFIPDASSNFADFYNPIAKEITKKTGVELKIEFGVGDVKQKYALMAASDKYPDIILNKDDSMSTLLKAKGIIKLDDLIEKYGPNIKKFYGDKISRLKYSTSDPSIYGLGYGGAINDTPPGYYWNTAFQLQLGALKEQGYPQVKSLADYEKVIRTYVAAHPLTDGKKTLGMSIITADGWRWAISLTNPAYYANGQPDNGEWNVDEKTGKVTIHYKQENDKTYFKWLNKMFNDGLLDPESFTQSYDAYKAKIATGRVVGLTDGLWEFYDGVSKLKADGKNDKTYLPLPVLTDPTTMKFSATASDGAVGMGGFSISKTAKNPEKLVNFFNYLASEEGQTLKEWGIKGVNYDEVDGKKVRKADQVAADMKDGVGFLRATGVKAFARGTFEWLQHGYGAKDSKGVMISSEDPKAIIDQSFTKDEKEALVAYKAQTFADLFPQPSTLPTRAYGSGATFVLGKTDETKVAWKKTQDTILKDIARAVMGKPEQFDANWTSFMNNLKDAGVEKVEAEATQEYKDRLKLWK